MEIGKRTRISDNQRDILERFYGRGMVGVGHLNYREMIESAVSSNNDSSYKGIKYRYHSDVNVDNLLLKTLDDIQKYTNIN